VKDLLAATGGPTTWGAKPYASQVFDEDAAVVQKLAKSGAILIGSYRWCSWRAAAVSLRGGIDDGAGTESVGPYAVERRIVERAGGGDGGRIGDVFIGIGNVGSILTPSAFCGVTGLRPTYGLVSRRGAMALSWTLDKVGPMCRSAEDCGLVLEAIAGNDNADPGSSGRGYRYAPQYAKKPSDLKVGYAPVDFAEWASEATRPAFQQALDAVKGMGVQLKEVELPDFPYGALVNNILAGEAASIFEDLIKSAGSTNWPTSGRSRG